MAIYLRCSSLSVCLSGQRLMTGDRRDMRDEVATWTRALAVALGRGGHEAGLRPELEPRQI